MADQQRGVVDQDVDCAACGQRVHLRLHQREVGDVECAGACAATGRARAGTDTASPVSSPTSRAAAAARRSPESTWPPGNAHRRAAGARARWTSKTWETSTVPHACRGKIIAHTPTRGGTGSNMARGDCRGD
jgi:hypothetical protein